MRCIRCGNVIEFVEEALEDIERRLCEENDFQIIDHRMDIVGYCSNCKKEV
jgi:Fur family ferric uptake transcriptional regulator